MMRSPLLLRRLPEVWRADLHAALFSVFLTLPQAIAFSALAQMPVAAAIWASVIPAIVAALTGREAHVVTGPVSMLLLMLGVTLSHHFAPGSRDAVAAAAIMVLMMSGFELLAAATGFVHVLHWMPPEAVRGITAGIGLSILMSQVGVVVGSTSLPTFSPLWTQAVWAIQGRWHWWSIASASLTLAVWFVLGHVQHPLLRRARWPLAVVMSSAILFRPDIPVIGNLTLGVPWVGDAILHPGGIVSATWPTLLGPALSMAALALTQSMLVSEGAALRGKARVMLRREALAQAAANAASALVCAIPVSASVNRSVAHETAGARTWRSVVLAALLVLAFAWFAQPLVSLLSMPALAALLCAVAVGMVRGAFASNRPVVSMLFGGACVFIGMGTSVALAVAYGVHAHARASTDSGLPDHASLPVAPRFWSLNMQNGRR